MISVLISNREDNTWMKYPFLHKTKM